MTRTVSESFAPGTARVKTYRFGRVIRLKQDEVDAFIDNCRIEPGTLEHLYPEPIEQAK